MNYAFLFNLKAYFADKTLSTKEFVERLNNELIRYKTPTNKMLLNLIDSHDAHRFYSYLNGNKDLYLLSELFLISFIGLPMVYYGDEIFMEGGDDPFNRKGMEWESKEFNSEEFALMKKIFALRKLDAFKKGEMELSYSDEGLLILRRIYLNEKYTLIINNSNKSLNLANFLKDDSKIVLSNNVEGKSINSYGFILLSAQI